MPVNAVGGSAVDVGVLQLESAPAFRVTGTVVDADGSPVSGAMVRLVPGDAPNGAMPMSKHVITDAAGAFALEKVINGRYRVVAVPGLLIARVPVSKSGSSFRARESTTESAQGSVWTETRNGLTLQYRDEFATQETIEIDNTSQFGLVLRVRQPARR